MTIARFLRTEGPYLEAVFYVEGQTLRVMDEFSVDARNVPTPGELVDFEFAPELSRDESWEEIFSTNSGQKIGLDNVEGWRYHAYGQIVSINPVVVNCGVLSIEDAFHTNDPRVIGEFVRLTISCLGGYVHAI